MLTTERPTQTIDLQTLVEVGISHLDLSPEQHSVAVTEYGNVAQHLNRPESAVLKYEPKIYPQGSMASGTCVRPIQGTPFDIDIVCELVIPPSFTINDTLDMLLREMRAYKGRHYRLERKDRCIKLHYKEKFELDIVPAKRNGRSVSGVPILIPDGKVYRWKRSNPKAHLEWFDEVRRKVIMLKEGRLVTLSADIAPPPDPTTPANKTVLQTVVQVLKFHRNQYFNEREDAPSSATVTTLAGLVYDGEQELIEALSKVVEAMDAGVNQQAPWVPNPRYLPEDFADRWSKMPPNRREAYFEWSEQVKENVSSLRTARLKDLSEALAPFMGKTAAVRALKEVNHTGVQTLRDNGTLHCLTGTGLLGAQSGTSIQVPKQTFYGLDVSG